MKLAIVKNDDMGDWYSIEMAEHDGRHWLQPTEYGASLMYSGRISDADVEGPAREMLAIAEAIEKRGEASFKRCKVRIEGDTAYFRSPRNSQRDGVATLAEADDLAAQIRASVTVPEGAPTDD